MLIILIFISILFTLSMSLQKSCLQRKCCPLLTNSSTSPKLVYKKWCDSGRSIQFTVAYTEIQQSRVNSVRGGGSDWMMRSQTKCEGIWQKNIVFLFISRSGADHNQHDHRWDQHNSLFKVDLSLKQQLTFTCLTWLFLPSVMFDIVSTTMLELMLFSLKQIMLHFFPLCVVVTWTQSSKQGKQAQTSTKGRHWLSTKMCSIASE